MVEVSEGCMNENTYRLSCHYCGKCGRKFTWNGIDDSQVKPRNLNPEIQKEFIIIEPREGEGNENR